MGTDWMLLAVPKQDYDELKHMIDFRQEQRGEPPAPSAEALRDTQLAVEAVKRKVLDEHKPWPLEALSRLAEGSTITTERFSRVMDLCAHTPGEFISTEGIAEETEMTVNEWRAACRKLGAHLRKHYPDVPTWEREPNAAQPMWPLANVAGRNLQARDQLYVAITAEQAHRWSEVR
ncbi:hypothetical protein [Microbacterium sp. Marseille-Q6648]|uniref:hypothetical protein n=1 Tax=Microbacterium sp. Marseille-Q6648 TaxID=2937991 RepID=UPI0020410952|nr:hypothetical protein [Microbacterium sp. Marseille-Q6648]